MSSKAYRRIVPAVAGILALVVLVAVDRAESRRGERAAPVSTTAAEDAAPGAAGMRVTLDPLTGQLRSRPVSEEEAAPGARELTPAERLNTYGGDLLQEPVPLGGFKVDLRGRFQTAVVATIDPETGETTLECERAAVAEEPGNEE